MIRREFPLYERMHAAAQGHFTLTDLRTTGSSMSILTPQHEMTLCGGPKTNRVGVRHERMSDFSR